jgi:hypothetical protein
MRQMQRMMYELAELKRQSGTAQRQGYVHEVKEEGGERKARVVLGMKKDGSPWLSPWMHSEEQRGGSRHQTLLEKGQNVSITGHGSDYRMGHLTPQAEGKSFPQPAHASKINGDTSQVGKLRVSNNRPKKQESGGGGAAGGSGGSGGGGQQEDGEHFHETWIAEEDDNPPKHQDQTGKATTGGSGASSSSSSSSQQGGQSQQSSDKAAVKHRVSEKGGITDRVGEDVRHQTHKKGAKMKAKKDTIVLVDKEEERTKIKSKLPPYVDKPWVIKDWEDPIDDDNA